MTLTVVGQRHFHTISKDMKVHDLCDVKFNKPDKLTGKQTRIY